MADLSAGQTALMYAGLAVFWVFVFWLLFSKKGNSILWALGSVFAAGCLVGCLFLHWEPYTAMICGTAGFLLGMAVKEWLRDDTTGHRSGQQQPDPSAHRMERSQPEQSLLSNRGYVSREFQSDPGATPRA